MDPNPPWHHTVYEDIEHWSVEKLRDEYKELSRELRIFGKKDQDHLVRMFAVSRWLALRGGDPAEVAREVQEELDSGVWG